MRWVNSKSETRNPKQIRMTEILKFQTRVLNFDVSNLKFVSCFGFRVSNLKNINFLRERGFSLIELMLTVSFVMLGAILLQGSYMRSAEIYGRYTHSLSSMVWMQEQIAQAKEDLLFSGDDVPSESGVVDASGKEIHWSREVQPAAGSNLYSIGMKMSWKEGPKFIEMEGEQVVYKKPSTAL